MGILEDIFSASFHCESLPQFPDWIEWRHISRGRTHCPICLGLDKCWFTETNKPKLPQHPLCHCITFSIPLSLVLKDAKSECDVRKFSEYVLHPENNRGKKVLFNNWGYDTPDSQLLQKEFEKQALEKYTKGQYTLGVLDEYGQRITIQIEFIDRNTQKEIIANSGWMVCPNGKIRCNTPLVGGKKK